jgi:hypothetical protein
MVFRQPSLFLAGVAGATFAKKGEGSRENGLWGPKCEQGKLLPSAKIRGFWSSVKITIKNAARYTYKRSEKKKSRQKALIFKRRINFCKKPYIFV